MKKQLPKVKGRWLWFVVDAEGLPKFRVKLKDRKMFVDGGYTVRRLWVGEGAKKS